MGDKNLQKTKKIVLTVVGILLLVAAFAVGIWCSNEQKANSTPVTSMQFIMDTFIEQKMYGRSAQKVVDEINSSLKDFEQRMSMHLDESEVTMINLNAGKKFVSVSQETFDCIKLAKEYSEKSNGRFDVTIAPLTKLWDITGLDPRVPPKEEIDKALELVDYQDILLDEKNRGVMLAKKGQAIDLGGIAKGMAAEIVMNIAREKGIESGYVSLGGNLAVIGQKPDGSEYVFGVRDPRGDASEYIGTVHLPGKTMATTGDYERYFVEDGVTYHHILDPATGYPCKSDFISVTIISEHGALADYLSTALFMMEKEDALSMINSEEFEAILVDQEKNVYWSNSLEGNFRPNETKTEYQFHSAGREGK